MTILVITYHLYSPLLLTVPVLVMHIQSAYSRLVAE